MPRPPGRPPKKKTTPSLATEKAIWVWRTDPALFEKIEAVAKKQGVTPTSVLNQIVKDWFAGDIPTMEERMQMRRKKKEQEKIPWYLKRPDGQNS